MKSLMRTGIALAEAGHLPDSVLRFGMRQLIAQRLRQEGAGHRNRARARYEACLAELRQADVAKATDIANAQHYEVPADFFRLVLGPHLKYSACLWDEGAHDLAEAEAAMLACYAERAELGDGMRLLDLGCGWGSLSLWAAERYPASRILAVSNSTGQRAFIESEAKRRGLGNLDVMTADISRGFDPGEQFDRIVSVEMFEHIRNHAPLLKRIAGWLAADGKLFVHIFCHRHLLYTFEDGGPGDWMAREFFTGGLMPSRDLLPQLNDALEVEAIWDVNGMNYRHTAAAWRERLDAEREAAARILASGGIDGMRAVQRWRLFFMACEELFGYDRGKAWQVCHYRMAPL